MFTTLLRRPRRGTRRVTDSDTRRADSIAAASPNLDPRRRATIDSVAPDDYDEDEDEDEDNDGPSPGPRFLRGGRLHNNGEQARDEDGQRTSLPMLPLFSSTHLDSLPVYSLTHAIRIIVCARTETTLTWDQLRTPQISQFLVKPMQHQIRMQHFSRATLYALMANCLQFTKEGQLYAANAGTSNTRAQVCELLALKMLKEYSTRELIDALAYDFYPLQGLPGSPHMTTSPEAGSKASRAVARASRTSTLEVAIRASAKHFLAHPVVVQQLEGIWNGAITFYSTADRLHRENPGSPFPNHAGGISKADARTPLLGSAAPRGDAQQDMAGRRTVALYDPKQASMLKLSRLRVPRYRSFLSTLSLAILIGLFLAVLAERSVRITALELVFWFWSAGFMLDELVGFNEQGFALYIMSFWNLFDLGILVLLIVYYCMRVYGVFMVDSHHWNGMAYDVLAANGILLLPRIFSVLDHYQYFSQLLIAFRLMAADLVAVFTLVLIVCSGFYVFFTFANNESDGVDVAYRIFQIVMGFTPAAWDVWPTYNWLGRALMALFLIICHFVVVTILITVLTNSFMRIASNATEEHQFLFAVNTISMVKNDALFSYIAPSNIFAWLLMPLRYCMPLRTFVWMNRTIIKITHFPVLFLIYLYERLWLAPSMFEPTDLIENPGRGKERSFSLLDGGHRPAMFSPGARVREESVAGFHKDRALEELFRRGPGSASLRVQLRQERRKTQNAIRTWMDQHEDEAESATNWPTLESRGTPGWQRRLSTGWDRPSNLKNVTDIRSVASDPAELLSNHGGPQFPRSALKRNFRPLSPQIKDQTDADGDDELVTNDEDEEDNITNDRRSRDGKDESANEDEGYFMTPMTSRFGQLVSPQSPSGKGIPATPRAGNSRRSGLHSRTLSTNTILYNPEDLKPPSHSSPSTSVGKPAVTSGRQSGRSAGEKTPARNSSPRRSSPRRVKHGDNSKPRPILPPRGLTETGGVTRSALLSIDPLHRPGANRRLSSADLSLMSDPASLAFAPDDAQGGLAGSFQTQMAMAMMKDKRMRSSGADTGDRDRISRLVLARMKTLEESFGEMIKEMRDMKSGGSTSGLVTRRNSSSDDMKSLGQLDGSRGQRPRRAKGGDVVPAKKSAGKRPASRRSMKANALDKGKGKELRYTSTEGEDDDDADFSRRGTSL